MSSEEPTAQFEGVLASLVAPQQLFSRAEVLADPCPIPPLPGIYAWYFRQAPTGFVIEGCVETNRRPLLYVGISPHGPGSTQNLRKRIRYHYRGNAYGSTLRRTLGVLLSKESGFRLRRVGSGKRTTFTHSGEQWLDRWMAENAFVTWCPCPEPWLLEELVIKRLRVPLNIAHNSHETFCVTLRDLRRQAIADSLVLPIASEQGQTRKRR